MPRYLVVRGSRPDRPDRPRARRGRPPSRPRLAAGSRLALAGLAALLAANLLAGCTSTPPPLPGATLRAFVAAWNHRDYRAMAAQVLHPPDLQRALALVTKGLGTAPQFHAAGPLRGRGGARTATVDTRFHFDGIGDWTARGLVHLTLDGSRWRVEWSPRIVDTRLDPGDRLGLDVGPWPARAAILGSGGASLTTEAAVVTMGLEGSRITNPSALSAGLVQAGVPSAQVSAAIASATAQPTLFIPVERYSQAEYETLKPIVYPLPGTVFQTSDSRTAITPDLGAQIVGSVGPITAQQLSQLGAPYAAGDVVGQTGIEAADQRRLAGTPGARVEVLGPSGRRRSTLASFAPKPGSAVQTTIDPTTQQAAEQALDGVSDAAAMVVVQPSTGDVLASVSRPTDGFDNALEGEFPPGSTFKVITSSDLIEHGATPQSPASCPATITEGGETFHNFEGEASPSLSLEQAFAESCNAAFIGLGSTLPDASFPEVARQFGLGIPIRFGLDAYPGSVPTPTSDAIRAATSIGQADVLVSPLDMAMVAAAAASGTLREPRLVAGAPDDSAAPHALPADVTSDLHQMMADVVTSGTAADEGLPAGTSGKTGTAEFGTANPPATHAWFIGFRGDLAFCVLVVGGGIGGAVAAPIAAKFLDTLDDGA